MNPKLPLYGASLALLIGLGACTPAVIKQASPSIGKTVGALDAPSPDVLPIILSEPIAADPQKAADNYRELLKLQPDTRTRTEATRRLADLQVQIEDGRGNTTASEPSLREAVGLYDELLRTAPDDKDHDRVLYQLARAKQNLGDVEGAIETLQRLAERHPDSELAHDGHFRRGELLFLQLRYAEAETEYRKVMALQSRTPFFERAQYKYGWSLYKQSKHDAAIATFFDILDRELPANASHEPDTALAGVDQAAFDLVKDSLRVVTSSLATQGGGAALNDYFARHDTPRFHPLIYAALGKALLEKRRYTEGAEAYAAFIARHPDSPLSPDFQSKVIAAYDDGGFRNLVVREKQRYAAAYDPDAAYWNGQPATPAVMTQLRTHLEDLARHEHAQAQAQAQRETQDAAPHFLAAARGYQRIITLYPQDAQLAQINFLLGDALLDGGHTLEAAQQYARTAYGYAAYANAAEAAHASVLAYQKHATEVAAGQRAPSLRLAIDASLRLADQFPAHPQRNAVLTQTAQDLFELHAFDEAIAVAARVLKAPQAVDGDLRRAAWSVTGASQFALQRYAEAETAFSEELALTADSAAQYAEVAEQLAASIYKQGETARNGDDLRAAATHFLRVGRAAPQASILAVAEYDGAAALIALEDWTSASDVLERFGRMFAEHPLQADVDKKLAVAYQKDGKAVKAAPIYGRIARRSTETADTRREAAWLSATLFDQAAAAEARDAYAFYVSGFPRPLDRSLDARSRLVDYARASGDRDQLNHWLRELVAADDNAGTERSEQSRMLAAQSSLALGRVEAARAGTLRLTLPVERSLPGKRQAVELAIQWLNQAGTYGFADVTTAATYEVGLIYQDFGRALMESERPRGLSVLEREQYDLLLEEQAYPFEERALETHQTNLQRLNQGVYDIWIARSASALAQMAPAKFGKREQGEQRYEQLR